MNISKCILIALLAFSACTDSGTEPWAGSTEYNLPYAQITLPSELVQQESGAVGRVNPEFAGIVENHHIAVQFCINTLPIQAQFREYQEQEIILSGKRAVLFRGLGIFHMYDSHFSSLVGLKASGNPNGSAVIVMIEIDSPEAYDIAWRILMSMHPEPRNTVQL
jgi:hypothetical protein